MNKLRRRFLSQHLEREKDYWLGKLSGGFNVAGLPLDFIRPEVHGDRKETVSFDIAPEHAGKILQAANRQEPSILAHLLTAMKICLAKYNDVEEVTVGTTIHERHREDALLNKVLALRTRVGGDATPKELLEDVNHTLYDAYKHQKYPFESILEHLNLTNEDAPAPRFGVVVLLDTINNKENVRELHNDLTVTFSHAGEAINGVIEYNPELFKRETIEAFVAHYAQVLRNVLDSPDRKISQIGMLSENERRQLIYDFNDTRSDYPKHKTIPELFEAQAAHTPDAVALVFQDTELTYRELNERANQLAHHLRTLGVGAEVLVGLCVERSVEMVVGLLAILKAGGAYVPLDPTYPADRLSFMIEDAQVPVLLTQERLVESLPAPQARVVRLDSEWDEIARHANDNLPGLSQPENLAYISYTSGSTGRPKGVSVVHRAVARLVKETNYVEFKTGDSFLQLAPLAFDASTFEIWGSLLNGARLVVMPPHAPSLNELGAAITRYEITTLWLTAGLFHLMAGERLESLISVRQLLAGGDVLSAAHVQKFLRAAEGSTLINGYGPTENTTFTCCYPMTNGTELEHSVPIGHPISNTQAYVLDRYLQPVPVGVTGELYTGGDGLARGYLNRPELTAERFIPNPFSTQGGERLYNTGDLARMRADGVIEFMGRRDTQVKLRGFRIELGEIEAALNAHADVRESVVVMREDANGEKRLVAYIVAEGAQLPRPADWQSYLKKTLPEYMIPYAFVPLESLPLTANGKIDRRALPEPDEARPDADEGFVEARNEIESLIAGIWANVLRLESVSVNDDFFEIGGHSLLATRVMLRVQQVFGVELALWQMFERPTVAGLASAVEAAMSEGRRAPQIEAMVRPERIPLSYAQQRLWFLDRLMPGTPLYNVYVAFELHSAPNLPALESSLNEIVRRHEVLRTTFPSVHGQPAQHIAATATLSLKLEELGDVPASERESVAAKLIAEEALRPFDLERGPLVRAVLVNKGEGSVLLLTMHHIIADGWSLDVLSGELNALYKAFAEGRPSPLAELNIQYADYAMWQREWLRGEVLERQLDYWRQQLDGAPTVLELPADKPRPASQTFRGARHSFAVPEDARESLDADLKALSRSENATLFMTLFAAFNALLSRYTGQREILVGTPVANRNRAEVEDLIGFFSNTLALRTNLEGDPSFRQLVRRVREQALGAYAHQDVPFEKLVEEFGVERDLSRSPLFQVLFSLENTKARTGAGTDLTLNTLRVETGTAKVDLALYMLDTEQGLRGAFEYSTDLFEAETVARLSGHFLTLLEAVAANPDLRLSEMPLLTPAERQQLLDAYNDTRRDYPQDRTIHELFEAQAAQTPDAVALVFQSEELSYRELNERANQLAHHLRSLGVGAEVLVGLCVERSVEMVVGLLAILKAGGAYVPLDPQYPQERLSFMLEDSGVSVLLTQKHLLDALPSTHAVVVDVDSESAGIAAHDKQNLVGTTTPDALAYIIYTSGSTGTPKGVSVEHRNVVRLVKANEYARLDANEVLLQLAPISFDASTFEIWGSLLNGARLVVMPPHQPSLEELGAAIKHHEITTLWLTTGLFHLMVDERVEDLRRVRQLLTGGDVVSPAHVQKFLREADGCTLVNCYGPTENTTFTTYYPMNAVEEFGHSVPIGKPIINTQVYLLDEHLQPVPAGLRGELYTGGEGVARGYFNRPELTAERFIPDPFGTAAGARLYRTGDLCRFGSDGRIEFLGRSDTQVKLRGFRIELGEIEAPLARHEEVKEAVAVILKDEMSGDKRIVAYVVAAHEGGVGVDALRGHLKEKLPDYMIPAAFVMLDALPLTANGKIDRAALPDPDSIESGEEVERAAARTGIEEIVANIWTRVLGVDSVGVHDSFFDVGGHSLLATQVVSRLREALGVELEVRSLFENPTVAELAEAVATALRGGERVESEPVRRANRKRQPLSLSYGQQRLWFLNQLMPNTHLYNVPVHYRLQGELDVEALEKSFSEIVRRHEVLRTHIGMAGGQPVQIIDKPRRQKFDLADFSALQSPEERRAQLEREIRALWVQPFDLARGPLFRVKLIRYGRQEHRLLLTMHHIISDGWSVSLLTRELATLYEAYRNAGESPLEDLPIQYADYAVWQRQAQREKVLEKQLAYWRQQLDGAPTVLELPADKPRPEVETHHGASVLFSLNEEVYAGLKNVSREESVTLFMTLLAAFNVLLSRYSGQEDIIVGTPVANRNRAEVEDLIGFFSNTLALRAKPEAGLSFRQLLRQVKEVCLGAYAHQDVPFEKLVEEFGVERDLSRSPLFQVMFSLESAAGKAVELSSLKISPTVLDNETAKFDLSLGLFETERELTGAFEYSTDLFEAETIERMAGHFRTLLEAFIANPDLRLSELPLLTPDETRLFDTWNDTTRDYPQDRLMYELFEAQAARTPDAIALVFQDEQLTYRELNERANQLAHYLRGLGVGAEVLVGLCVERSVEMVVGLLAILKAGGAYVPLDPQYPQERLAFMLEDTRAPVLLTQERLVASLPVQQAKVVRLDTQWDEIARHANDNLPVSTTPADLAYVIYTSGSTGRPKGVAIEHRSATTFLHWALEVFPEQTLAGVLASTSICFDLSVFEIFAPLSRGGKIILAENALALPTLPAAGQVTLINTVPSAIAELVRMNGIPDSVRTVNLAGEALKLSLVQEVYKQPTIEHVFNLYGPSEDTTYSTFTLVERGQTTAVTIGRPVANTQVHLLDANLQRVPRGVAGELCLGGAGLARGYLNRPELTAEKFIPDPFSTAAGARLYRTGDLARYRPDGEIEYLGRVDHQVKLRGFRIELGEIEAALARYEGVREAVVVVREDAAGDKRLVAYLAAQPEHAPSVNQLRDYLKEKLPHYMIPSVYVVLAALPLTPNGKVNRAALPEPVEARPELAATYVMPRTKAENAVAAVWQEILRVEHVGINDNFFDLGGHSLLMVQAHAKLREFFERPDLSVIDLFKYPTVSALAKFLSREENETPAPPAPESLAAEAGATAVKTEAATATTAQQETAIAIIGMAGRFPGCRDLDEFWEKLKNGVELISSFSNEELAGRASDPASLDDPNFVKAGSVVEDADMFDASFFDMNPREAEITDPQHRLLLECAWQALEEAGYDSLRYDGRIGVYAGTSLSGYLQNIYANPEVMRAANPYQIVIGNDKDYLPTRISYKLNLKGPSLNVQTSCSTSLVAVHMACRSLLHDECEMALAGGISIRTPQKTGYYYQEGGINSPDGHCRAFDAGAQGTVPGNGGGLVLLKRLSDALADGDTIHAVILGSAINNDGSEKVGFTAPSVDGQAEVIASAQRAARVSPDTLTYIEAHGTGTPLGDPIELAALTQAFRAQTAKRDFCAVGSLKTNLGHLDAGAGIAGLIKTVLALKHRMIPPSLHFEQPNPQVNLEDSPFYVNRMLREWITEGLPRRAGVSSFGIGGTNAHVILEESPRTGTRLANDDGSHLLLLSAKTKTALEQMTGGLLAHLKRNGGNLNPRDVAYTLQTGRRVFEHKLMLVYKDLADAAAQLKKPDPRRVFNATTQPAHTRVVLMYPGQGAQYVQMGRGLYESQPVFRREVDACAELLKAHLGLDLRRLLYPSAAEAEAVAPQLNETFIAQPALFVVEYALTKLWMELGVQADAFIGHSIGEYVAACVAGVFSLEDALKLVAARGRLMQSMPKGTMLVVPLPEREVDALIGEELSVAAVNGASLCVVSGATEAIAELESRLTSQGVAGHRLQTSHAFHSQMMEAAVQPFVEIVRTVALHPPKLRYVSNLTGTWITAAQATDPNYWGEHLRRAVRFADGLSELLQEPGTVLLEVGPGTGLGALAKQHAGKEAGRAVLSTLRHAKAPVEDDAYFLNTAGQLWLTGRQLDWSALHAGGQPRRIALPTYPFERQRYWVDPEPNRAAQSVSHAQFKVQASDERAETVPTPVSATVAARHAPAAPAPLEGIISQPTSPTAQTAAVVRESVKQNGAHNNGARNGRRDAVRKIVAQQLQVSARQLEIMSQQLELLRRNSNGSKRKTVSTGTKE
ncbi:MAG TPA: amino acid adenylation domain-containing protein [Pyrinomonadaceae bacterium]|nr:amino acid adenylation domain-containing protein [Pyrinomonadaceae bacterium]